MTDKDKSKEKVEEKMLEGDRKRTYSEEGGS
jgi:hypothetical protein